MVVNKLLEEKRNLITDIKKLWRKYLDLLKVDQLSLFEFLEEKYYLHYKRLIKKRTISKEVDSLSDVISDEKLDMLDSKAQSKREKYHIFQTRETARGLPHVRNMYEKLFSVVFFEEIYYSPNNDSLSESIEA